MEHILIVEDETIIAIEIEDIVRDIGFKKTHRANTKDKALEFIEKNSVDIVLLDINLEGEFEGVDIARYLQERSPQTSIIFLTAYSDEIILQAISEIHFAAYLIKPFRKSELEVIINLERIKKDKKTQHYINITPEYTLNISKSILVYEDREIHLTKKELLLLGLLANNKSNIISFDNIELEIWGETGVTENTRRNLIYKLNKKLPITLIETHIGTGYSI